MEETILISYLNDFIFCPVSIYFHKLYGDLKRELYQTTYQTEGINAHKSIDNKTYSTRKTILQGIDIYSEQFNISGKIDLFDITTGILTERKRSVKEIYEGYIFQVYAQYYGLTEMGYNVNQIKIHSIIDNKNYRITLPTEDIEMDKKFRQLVTDIKEFNMENFEQKNKNKCLNCIYEPSCDRGIIC